MVSSGKSEVSDEYKPAPVYALAAARHTTEVDANGKRSAHPG